MNAYPSGSVQNALLGSISALSDRDKSQILLPTIRSLVETVATLPPADVVASVPEELTIRLLSSFDAAAADSLNNNETMWALFLQVVRTYLRSGMLYL